MIEIQNFCKQQHITVIDKNKVLFKTNEQPISRTPFKERIVQTTTTQEKITKHKAKKLHEYGYTIGSIRRGNKTEYIIVPLNNTIALSQKSNTIERLTDVEIDDKNHLARIIHENAGPLGKSKWYNIRNLRQEKANKNLRSNKLLPSWNLTRKEQSFKDIMNSYAKKQEHELKELPDNEIPIMTSTDNKLVCIKLEKDISHVGIIGKTGTGKTILSHTILDKMYWTAKKKIAIMNDSVNQCYAWGFPQDEAIFLPSLDKTSASPRPLPIVTFVPNSNTLRELPLEGIQTFRLLLSWQWLVENYKSFFQSKQEWKLEKSEKYLGRIREELMACKNPEEVYNTIKDNAKENGGEIPNQSVPKLQNIFQEIFDAGFVDISTTHGSGTWTFKTQNTFEEQPFVGIMRIGGVPVFNTLDLKTKHYYPQYVKFMLDQIMKYQQNLPLDEQEPIYLFFDEITDIYRIRRQKTIAGQKLVETITQGRNHNVGAIYTTQEYLGIEESIRANTGYLFCLLQGSNENRNRICKDFNLGKEVANAMGRLEKFECIAISNDKEFVLYDADGNKEEVTGAIEGRILAPLSRHRPPGGRIIGEEEYEEIKMENTT